MSIGSQAFHTCQDVIHVTSMYVTHGYHVCDTEMYVINVTRGRHAHDACMSRTLYLIHGCHACDT